jgi:DNA-binding NarL/FixJ family response regulator
MIIDWEDRFLKEITESRVSWDKSLAEFLQEHHENRGERHPRAKLTERDVHVIRKACEAGFSQKAIAKSFCVSPATVSNIVNLKQWKHVDDPRSS